ncbi:hypothetical protein AB0O52_13965 [Arthrobacter sp. NPDC080073]|uniref:hypothetical protein n=1 Tax=Arthrobacter sp. NPDC080073 TaxID=3155919 RepID=UPI00344909A1
MVRKTGIRAVAFWESAAMASDKEQSELIARGLEQLRVSRLRWVILVGACVAAAVLFGMAGAVLWRWWPCRASMVPAMLIPVLFVLLAVFSLNAPERVRKRLWVRRAVLIVPPLLGGLLVGWAFNDFIGSGGLYGGLGVGVASVLLNILNGWPRRSNAAP